MAKVQRAREELGRRLRQLRQESGRTGTGLAAQLGWPQSKISKIETGRQTPSEDDLTSWLRALGREDAASELLARLRTLDALYAEWRRELRSGTRVKQQQVLNRESQARMIRIFEANVIPGLLQTPDYAWHVLSQLVKRHASPPDVEEGVEARMRRQEILYRRDKRFHIVIAEGALRYGRCPAQIMMAQMDRLVALSAMRTIRLGAIPLLAALPESPMHGFWIFDSQAVVIETFAAELTLKQPDELELYGQVFERLATAASYDSAARKIITGALEDWSAKTG